MNTQSFLRQHTSNIALYSGILLSLALPSLSFANEFEDEWQAFQQAEQAAFNSFLSEHDRQFVGFLEQHWEEFDLFQGKVRDATPKPAKAPAVKNSLFSTEQSKLRRATALPTQNSFNNDASFFGHHISAISPIRVELPDLSRPSNKKLAAAWKALAEVDHKPLMTHIEQSRRQLGLGDWGTYLYVNYLLEKHIAEDKQKKSYLWFLLSKLGYDVKVAYGKHDIHLMLASKQTLYGKTYLNISGKTYYLVHATQHQGSLFSYAGKYDQNNRSFEINFKQVLSSSTQTQSRDIVFSEGHSNTKISLTYDAGFSHILNAYPQIELGYYFSAKPNPTMVASLRKQLQPRIQALSEREAIDYLLRMIQTGFTYALDQEQFGEENYLLAEESLLYQANDCEDRSILLAWLIKDLLKLDVVGLDFPGHIAVAVAIEAQENDWLIAQKGKRYVIADPTYIGATTGMVMPDYKTTIPKVIEF